jgi:hypothetical protein
MTASHSRILSEAYTYYTLYSIQYLSAACIIHVCDQLFGTNCYSTTNTEVSTMGGIIEGTHHQGHIVQGYFVP